MRTERRWRCTLVISLAAAVGLAAGCGESEEESGGGSAPTPQVGDAPARNPLTGGGTGGEASGSAGATGAMGSVAGEGEQMVVTDGVSFVVPEDWVREPTSSSMRAAQFSVPAPEGVEGEAGSFVVFRGIGGSADDNIVRWIGQIQDKAEPPVRDTTETEGGLVVSTVKMVGTYSVGPMMGGTGEPEPDTMFLGAVIEGGGRFPVFLRLTGPRVVLEPREGEWDALIGSVGVAGSDVP